MMQHMQETTPLDPDCDCYTAGILKSLHQAFAESREF